MPLPILTLHIAGGTLGMLSGFTAAFLKKGSRQHSLAGNVFAVSMTVLSASGIYLALLKSQPTNVVGGALTFYLVATAWVAARRKESGTDLFDWASLLVAFTLAAVELTWGVEAVISTHGMKYDYPPGPFFMMGSVAALATLGDIRMLVRGGIAGSQRIARHLWRMCFALFIASASIFLARQHLFPALLRKTGVLLLLSFLPLLLLIFWLIRVRFTRANSRSWALGAAKPFMSER